MSILNIWKDKKLVVNTIFSAYFLQAGLADLLCTGNDRSVRPELLTVNRLVFYQFFSVFTSAWDLWAVAF